MSNSVNSIKSESSLNNLLADGLMSMDLTVTDWQQQQLLQYILLLNKWNKTYNLTAVREPERMIGMHILDSLAVLPHLGAGVNLLDVGSGGGLPGIPVAIMRPDINVTMLDSLQKKTVFIQQAISVLLLKNANVVCERVESFQYIKKFDMVISRAFSELSDFANGAAHLVADGGRMMAMKGVLRQDEIDRLEQNPNTSIRFDHAIKLSVSQVDGMRHLLVLKRI